MAVTVPGEGQRGRNNNTRPACNWPRFMRSNNRQRSRGGRSGGGGGGGGHHHKQHHPGRPPNRNQIFDSSGPDVRVRGNAHQVFDKYQALAREAAASGDRIQAEAYWQYADHYFRLIQTMGGFGQRNNQGWGDGGGEEGQQAQQPSGQGGQANQANGNGHAQSERPDGREDRGEGEAGLGGVAFLQNGRNPQTDNDPAADDQPDIPEYTPGTGRRG